MVFGFDPVFLDIIVTPFDKDNKMLIKLPKNSEHITNNKIKIIPGGNGLNVARTLCKLQKNVYLVGSLSNFFKGLIQENIPNLKLFSPTNKKPNFTVVLQFSGNENQFNSVISDFSVNDLSIESLLLLTLSKVVPFSNIGLNSSGMLLFELICNYFLLLDKNSKKILLKGNIDEIIGLLTSILKNLNLNHQTTENNHDLKEYHKLIKANINKSITGLPQKIFFFDPSTLTSFKQYNWLTTFFSEYFSKLPGYKIISLNKYEFRKLMENNVDLSSFLNYQKNYIIKHDSEFVYVYKSSLDNFTKVLVPKLDSIVIKTTVGAGDAFNAGFLYKFSLNFDLIESVKFGIKIAQLYLLDKL